MKRDSLKTFSDQSEDINYNFSGIPLYINSGHLENFDNYRADVHWHFDLEYLYVLEGKIDYNVNGNIVSLEKDQGIFVNSKRLHYGFSLDEDNCHFIVIAIHPNFFNNHQFLFKDYWLSKFNFVMDDYCIFNSSDDSDCRPIQLIIDLYDHIYKGLSNPLFLLSKSAELVYLTGERLKSNDSMTNIDEDWLNFTEMAEYIYNNYDQKLLIKDIAKISNIGRNQCYNIFKKYSDKTPVEFMNDYRLDKSLSLLRDTNRSITEIASNCGFQTNSYFSYYFNQKMNKSPRTYRKELLNQTT